MPDPSVGQSGCRPTGVDLVREIEANPRLMDPGGGSLETTAACRVLFDLCRAQQHEIVELRARVVEIERRRRARWPKEDEWD